ncbi:MAG TPA: gliding motility-associated C-terminal domain-containing protein [Flavobacterium sp.]|nr:gliding motility-associated C-terminal domain-containing protein [Flavobacterium sp.]
MKISIKKIIVLICFFVLQISWGQDISLYKQYNGKYDFTYFGNTLNIVENNNIDDLPSPLCTILTSSSATLNLHTNDEIINAYLYWAGSGTGDFNVKLNNQEIKSTRNFILNSSSGYSFFSAFADVTAIVKTTGNGIYTLSELDLTDIIEDYCPFAGNFGGWAITIIYKNETLPQNQLNIYDGLQSVPTAIDITLTGLYVIDNKDAEIGFIAWEGDKNISVNESLRVNGDLIGNPPLNPSNNAFNGTNSIINSSTLYNMDLDVYSIENSVKIGDKSAKIQLTSGKDFVMINQIITKLNSQLTDATIKIDETFLQCNSREINVEYTVSNFNSSIELPAGIPISIYADTFLIQKTETLNPIPINGSESASITITIPNEIPNSFTLKFSVDDNGMGQGIISEIDESNNTNSSEIALLFSPSYNSPENLTSCDEGYGKGTFDFSNYETTVKVNPDDIITFYESESDAISNSNPIINTFNYIASYSPKTIFVKISNIDCYSLTSFLLNTIKCSPTIYNYVSANGDSKNDTFYIEGLRNVFFNFKLSIYNRWGTLVWEGNANSADWDGFSNQTLAIGSDKVPDGTYFYILDLNDPEYNSPLMGYLYFIK